MKAQVLKRDHQYSAGLNFNFFWSSLLNPEFSNHQEKKESFETDLNKLGLKIQDTLAISVCQGVKDALNYQV